MNWYWFLEVRLISGSGDWPRDSMKRRYLKCGCYETSIYLQFGGGSSVISANSFWIRLAEVDKAFEPNALALRSLVRLSLSRSLAAVADELEEDIVSSKSAHSQAMIWIRWESKLLVIFVLRLRQLSVSWAADFRRKRPERRGGETLANTQRMSPFQLELADIYFIQRVLSMFELADFHSRPPFRDG